MHLHARAESMKSIHGHPLHYCINQLAAQNIIDDLGVVSYKTILNCAKSGYYDLLMRAEYHWGGGDKNFLNEIRNLLHGRITAAKVKNYPDMLAAIGSVLRGEYDFINLINVNFNDITAEILLNIARRRILHDDTLTKMIIRADGAISTLTTRAIAVELVTGAIYSAIKNYEKMRKLHEAGCKWNDNILQVLIRCISKSCDIYEKRQCCKMLEYVLEQGHTVAREDIEYARRSGLSHTVRLLYKYKR